MEANLRTGGSLLPGTSTDNKCRRLVEKWNLIRMNGLEKINKSAVYEKTVTIEDIYGTDEPVIPEGYEAIAFRSPRDGEKFLSNRHYVKNEIFTCQRRPTEKHFWTDADMRIIVRKKPKEFTDTEILETILPWLNSCVPSGYLIGVKGWTSKSLLLNNATFSADWRDLKKAIVEKMRADYENGCTKGTKE